MAEELHFSTTIKEERYKELLPQIAALVQDEPDAIANMANVAAALWESFHFFWIGFYRVIEDELVLSPFQGPIACSRIRKGRGVCGTAWLEKRAVVVPDVDLFPGHIACNSASKSEIVVPLIKKEQVVAVLDIDSDHLDSFDETDVFYLTKIVALLG